MMHIVNLIIGPNAVVLCTRISIADMRSFEASKEESVDKSTMRSDLEENFYAEEGPLYEDRMAD